MKKKILVFLLISVFILSMCITSGSAKELDSLAYIASLSKLEPVGSGNLNAITEIAELKANSLPSSYSSRDLGYTTEIRQQSSNICWAYSSLASLESLLLKSGERVGHLSPEHMNVWGSIDGSGLGWQREDLVNDGGYSYIPMGYLTSWSGPLNDSDFPVGTEKSEFETANSLYSPQYGVTDIKYVTRETPIETVKSYIMDYGAVVANFNADTVKYMNASTDAFYCSNSAIPTSSLYGHAVSIVGWDDNYSKENFSTSSSGDTPNQNGAWLIKNSWGKYINDNGGYFWISYEDAWIFHSIFGPSFAIAGYEKLDGSKDIYQNEIYGATTQFPYITDEYTVPADEITYINVFDFSSEADILDSVVFESTSFDADYTVYYIPVFGDKPTQETFLWQELATGTVDYTGYISVDTNDFDLPEGKGAIGIKIDNTRTYTENKDKAGYEYIPNSIGVCEWLAFSGGYYFKNQGKAGESFIMYDEYGINQSYDLMDFYAEYLNDDMAATFVIKAITKNPDYIPDPTETTTQETTTESTTATQLNTFSLDINLELIGENKLTVIANATGGSGEYEFEFSVNDTVVQSYSDKNYVSIVFSQDNDYIIKVSAKDTNGRVVTTKSTVTVEDDKLVTPGSSNPTTPTDPTEPTQPSSSTSAATESTPTATQAVKAFIMGDTDYNGTITIKDTTIIRKYLAKMIELDEITLAIADVDGNEKCSIKDATAIQKYIALIETYTNVGKTVMLYD